MAQTFEDSHFKWTAQFDDVTLRDCDEIIGKLDKHLRDNPRCMEIEALLFKAFLYVAQWRRAKNRNSKEAKKCLEIAFSKINKCQNDNARNGYSIVGYTLYWQIECNRQVESRKIEYARRISAIVKRPECNAFINATRAFSLSLLGPKRLTESLKYYAEALTGYQDNTDWLFGYALVCGKKARIEGDVEAVEKEETIYNKILQQDPNHVLAMVFLAQSIHYYHREPRYKLKTMFNKVLALARRDDHGHTKVFTRVARFYRQIYDFKLALDILEEAECSIDDDPHEMLFHQKAKVYLVKYRRYDILQRRTRESLLTGEKVRDKYSLLHEAIIHLTEAIDRCDSGVTFRLDRAYAYEQLGMYEEALDEYNILIDVSIDYHIVDRTIVYLRYGLYLNRRRMEIGNVDLMMNYLSKGIELHVLQSDIHDKNSIRSRVFWAMSFFDRTNANRSLSETCKVRAEALYRLGWLRLLFSDVALKDWHQSALSKNNPTRKTHLQLYEQAYDEIGNNTNDNPAPPAPGLVSDIIEGLIICHLKEGRKENLIKVVELMQRLQSYNVNSPSEKLADLKLSQCEQSNESERPHLLSEAVQEGSLDACERLCEWFESKTCPSSDPEVLRYCVQIQNCLSRDKLMYRLYKSLGGLFLHTLIDTADLNNSEIDRKKSVLQSIHNIVKPKNDDLDELRELYLRWLESREANSGHADLIRHSSKVICCARFALAHAIASFQRRFCSWYAPKLAKSRDNDTADSVEFRIVKAAPHIKEKKLNRGGVTKIVTTLKEAVQKELRGMLEKAGPKKRSMPGFSLQFPDLFEYLTSIQPAANLDGSYDWIVALNILTNTHKHEEPLSQIEYTVCVGKDDNGDIRRIFNIEVLNQTARFKVETIVMQFREAEKQFDMYRMGLRFAGWKSLRVNRYREMEGISV